MNRSHPSLWSVGVFAKLTGVSIRTLRFYDRKALLRPASLSVAGYRLYSAKELMRLQQILTLKTLGYPLAEIRQILDVAQGQDIAALLQAQRKALEQQIERLQKLVQAIGYAQSELAHSGELSWQTLQSMIEVMAMKPSKDSQQWTKQFYTQEQLEQLAAGNYSEEDALRDAGRWNELIAEVNAAISMGLDPASPEAQALADRWQGLIGEFTQGDPGVRSSLNDLWANTDSAPEDFQAIAQKVKPAGEFIQRVLAARNKV